MPNNRSKAYYAALDSILDQTATLNGPLGAVTLKEEVREEILDPEEPKRIIRKYGIVAYATVRVQVNASIPYNS